MATQQAMPWEEYQSTPAGGGQGVVIPAAPEKPNLPSPTRETERWRVMQPDEIKSAGLQEGQRYQINEAGKIEPITSKELTEGEAKAVGFYQRMRSSDTQLNRLNLDPQGLSTLITQRVAPNFSRGALSDERRSQLDAMENFIAASLRLESGAAIGPAEFEKQARIFFPQPGAGQNEIDTKKQQRELAILGFKAVAGENGARRADENLRTLGFVDENGLPVVGQNAGQQLALTAGENFSTDQDKAIAAAVNQALANGGGVQELAAAAQAAGGQISPDDIANFQAAVEARAQGQAVTFNPQKTGKRNPISQMIGEAALTPEGTAVTSFLNATGVGIPSLIAGDEISGLEQLNPKSAMLGNIAGSMLGTAGLAKGARAALGAVAPSIASRVAGGGLTGAVAREALTEGAYGGLYAANTGGDIGEGLALGAVGSLGGRVVGAGVRRAAPVVGRLMGRGDVPPDGGIPPAGPTGGAPQGMPPQSAPPPAGMADDTFTPTTTSFRSGGAAGTTDEGIRVTRAQELPVPIELAQFQRSRLFEEQQRARDLAKNNEVGGPIRELLKEQQDKLRQNFDAFLDQTGSREWDNRREQGVVVDDALKTLAKRMNNKVNALYKRAEKSGELAEPVDMGGLADELNNLRAERTAAPVIKGLADELAVRELATGSLEKGTLKMKRPLTLNEAEELRKKVNRIAKQNDPNDLRVGAELKSLIDNLTENSGGETYKAARAARKEVGDKFERVSLVKKLVGMKPGTTDRQVALENVVETAITSGSTSLDDIKALKSVLGEAGPRGQRAWRELQGATLEHIRNKAYRSQTDETGQRVLYPSQLEGVIADLDKGGKLDFVFDKRTAELLRTMGEVSKDLFTAPPGSVNSSNTASAMTNAMDTLVTFMLSGAPIPAGKVSTSLINSLRSRGLRKEVKRLVSTEQN